MPSAAEIRAAIKADPFWFPRVVLGRSYWSKQAELYRALHESDRVAAKGGHATGKTYAAADFVVEYAATRPGAQVVILGPTFEQAKGGVWKDVRAAYYGARTPVGGVMGADSWTLGERWSVRVRGADKPEALHGVHGANVLIVIDEAAGIREDLWSAVESLLASEGAKLVLLFNPTRPTGYARDACTNPRFRVVTLSCLDHPNVVSGSNVYPGAVTAAWVAEVKARCDLTRDEDYWRGHVLGEFPSADPDALLGLGDLEASEKAPPVDDVPRLALDVARFGSDRNVLVYVDGKRRAQLVEEWAGQDLMWTAGRLMRAVRDLGVDPRMTFVDSCGVGGGVVDRCREAGVPVVGVDAGSKATGRWASVVGRETPFANRRAEMFWTLRCICKSLAVTIPRDFWADLGMIRVGYRGTDLAIRSKDDMRKEHGRSPDRADALALAFADPQPSFICEVW